MFSDRDLNSKNIIFRKASSNDFDHMIAIIGNYYTQNKIEDNANNKRKPPWIWINDPQLSFNLMIINKQIVGFYIARIIPYNNHLHSFFIDKRYRGLGLGRKLLQEHWREGLQKKSFNIKTFTLHVHKTNILGVNFYQKYSYKKVNQSRILLSEDSGLGSWARNCHEKDQWPLRDGIDLYYLSANNACLIT